MHRLVIFGLLACAIAHAMDLLCPKCRAWQWWSGDAEAIHRASTVTAFTYEVHREYFSQMKHGTAPTLYAFWKQRRDLYMSPHQFASLSTSQSAFWAILAAICLDWAEEFRCDLGCGGFTEAPILIGDGKALLCKPSVSQETLPTLHSLPAPRSNYLRIGSRFSDRVLVSDAKTRDLILRWAGRTRHKKDGKQRPAWDPAELPSLRTALSNHAAFLSPLVEYTESLRSLIQTAYRDFLAEITYPSCVGGGLFKSIDVICPLLRVLATGSTITPQCKQTLDHNFPALASILQSDQTLTGGFPPRFRDTLEVFHLCFVQDKRHPNLETSILAMSVYNDSYSHISELMFHFLLSSSYFYLFCHFGRHLSLSFVCRCDQWMKREVSQAELSELHKEFQ